MNYLTFWLTGLPASGKTTLGSKLYQSLMNNGISTVFIDGDEVRKSLCSDLGFTTNDRKENIKRAASLARIINDSQIYTICCFVSPTNEIRDLAREIIGESCFIEIFVDTSIDVCKSRDVKNLYQRAVSGEISEFTGVSAPFEEPTKPSIHLNNNYSLEETFNILNEQVLSIIARNENSCLKI